MFNAIYLAMHTVQTYVHACAISKLFNLIFILIFFVSLVSCGCWCGVALPRGALGWSAVCDCGISMAYSLIGYVCMDDNPLAKAYVLSSRRDTQNTYHNFCFYHITFNCSTFIFVPLSGSLGTSIFDTNAFLVGASGGVYALLAGHLANILLVSNHFSPIR